MNSISPKLLRILEMCKFKYVAWYSTMTKVELKKKSQFEISYRIERKELNVDITKFLWPEK